MQVHYALFFWLCFWSPPTPEKNIWLLSCLMIRYVRHLDANFACLLIGAEQLLYSVFITDVCLLHLEIRLMRTVGVNHHIKVVDHKTTRCAALLYSTKKNRFMALNRNLFYLFYQSKFYFSSATLIAIVHPMLFLPSSKFLWTDIWGEEEDIW